MSVSHVANDARIASRRRRLRLLLAILCAAGLVSAAGAWWWDRRYQSAMEEIESRIVAGQYAIASQHLNELLSWKADPNGRIAYLLGSCELARGRNQAADEAWARAAPGAAFWNKSFESRIHLFHESGQFAAAERVARDASLDPRNDRTAVLESLVPIYREQGRLDEAARLTEDRWEFLNAKGEGTLEPAIKLILQHIELTLKAVPPETLRASIERAALLAPDDDRVWLSRANLAIRTGEYDEARRWLDACHQRRPDDVPVWRARLNWAIATNRTDVVQQAATRLPESESPPAGRHRTDAWLASRRGDVAAERRALERLLAADPADSTAIDRLAQLAEKIGQLQQAIELRQRKEQTSRLQARYEKLYERKQPLRDAMEMARLAQGLGRGFEARGFLTLAISRNPDRDDLRHDLGRLSKRKGGVAREVQTAPEAR